ncbi:MAG: hypothetical protein ACYDHC_13675 [Desulfuromonadaceae bacterium]
MKNFTQHPTVIYDLPLSKGIPILRPEQVVLRFGSAGSIDIGSICYLHRGGKKRRTVEGSDQVDISSFNSSRSKKVSALLGFISECDQYTGQRAGTLYGKFSTFTSVFMSWADSNGHSGLFDDEDATRNAFRGFVTHLRERVIQNQIGLNAAARLQERILWVLENFLGIDDLVRGVNLLVRSEEATEQTMPPCENTQGKVIALCEAFFLGLSNLVIESKDYPFRLKMPDYLQWESNAIWVFPLLQWCVPPPLNDDCLKGDLGARGYNYAAGRVALLSEIKHKFAKTTYKPGSAISRARKRISTANQDTHDYARIQAAQIAHNAFVMLFVASIGMNKAQVLELIWGDDEFELGVERQGFRTLKWRAGGKSCEFEISPVFIPKFKLFLDLRRYLLNGAKCDYLFFTLGTNANKSSVPRQLGKSIFSDLAVMLGRFDTGVKVTVREWRAAKCDWLVKNTDLATAARVMQHSERTLLKSYVAGSPTEHLNEMTRYFDKVSDVVANKGQQIEHGVERVTGVCCDFGSPQEVTQNAPIKPDCRAPEGCLFCNKFKVHADERDTRKLLSCRHCLLLTAPLATSQEQFESLFSPILGRIQAILDEIDVREPGMVSLIQVEVEEEGELDPYWAGKMEMLTALELVTLP